MSCIGTRLALEIHVWRIKKHTLWNYLKTQRNCMMQLSMTFVYYHLNFWYSVVHFDYLWICMSFSIFYLSLQLTICYILNHLHCCRTIRNFSYFSRSFNINKSLKPMTPWPTCKAWASNSVYACPILISIQLYLLIYKIVYSDVKKELDCRTLSQICMLFIYHDLTKLPLRKTIFYLPERLTFNLTI